MVFWTHRGHLQVQQQLIKVVKLVQLQLHHHHLTLELQQSTRQPVQNHPDRPPPLRLHQLLVDLLQTAEDLQVLQVEDSPVLEHLQPVLLRARRLVRKLVLKEVLESAVSRSLPVRGAEDQ